VFFGFWVFGRRKGKYIMNEHIRRGGKALHAGTNALLEVNRKMKGRLFEMLLVVEEEV
jgi:hypothetical protein